MYEVRGLDAADLKNEIHKMLCTCRYTIVSTVLRLLRR